MKPVHYILLAYHLTGDSNVIFFSSEEKAKAKFRQITEPLLAICHSESLEPEDDFEIMHTHEDGSPRACRFNGGVNDELDEILAGVNLYVEVGTRMVDENIDFYIAEFSEHVDDSSISFYTCDDATTKYNDLIEEGIDIASNNRGIVINRYDNTTWEDSDKNTMFQESIGKPYGEAFFGYDIDCYYTYRCGKIEITDGADELVIEEETNMNYTVPADSIHIAFDPKPFEVHDFGTGKSLILGVYRNYAKAVEVVTAAIKDADMDIDENEPSQFIETHAIE